MLKCHVIFRESENTYGATTADADEFPKGLDDLNLTCFPDEPIYETGEAFLSAENIPESSISELNPS